MRRVRAYSFSPLLCVFLCLASSTVAGRVRASSCWMFYNGILPASLYASSVSVYKLFRVRSTLSHPRDARLICYSLAVFAVLQPVRLLGDAVELAPVNKDTLRHCDVVCVHIHTYYMYV